MYMSNRRLSQRLGQLNKIPIIKVPASVLAEYHCIAMVLADKNGVDLPLFGHCDSLLSLAWFVL